MKNKVSSIDIYFIAAILLSLIFFSFKSFSNQPDVIFNHYPDGTTQMHFDANRVTEEQALDIMTRFIIKRERGDLFKEEKDKIKKF